MRVDLCLTEPEFGTTISSDLEHGEWRTIPGFDSKRLIVSSKGWYKIEKQGRWSNPRRGTGHKKDDGTLRHSLYYNGFNYYVYELVCRAWKGPKPSALHSVDHKDRNSSNDDESNLSWVTKVEQRSNQDKCKQNSLSKAIYIRKLDCDEDKWIFCLSKSEAKRKYGVHPAICDVANGKIDQCGGFTAQWAPCESQDHLKAGDDSNLRYPPTNGLSIDYPETGSSLEDEQWKTVPNNPKFKVSTRGRLQIQIGKTCGWGFIQTPSIRKGLEYATVKINKQSKPFHVVVWETFCSPIPHGYSIDHKIPTRKWDNRLCNLQCITVSEQNTKEKKGPMSLSKSHDDEKIAVEGREAGNDVWERFSSQHEASRILHARFPDKKFGQGNIQSGIHTGRIRYGWYFRAAKC